jgi:hypothetical protein
MGYSINIIVQRQELPFIPRIVNRRKKVVALSERSKVNKFIFINAANNCFVAVACFHSAYSLISSAFELRHVSKYDFLNGVLYTMFDSLYIRQL